EAGASTDGTTIYLPPYIDTFAARADNFGAFKVFTTHQAGHMEFGSFGFDFERPGTVLATRRRSAKAQLGTAVTPMERYFDLLADRRLAADLFAIAEDARIEAKIAAEYMGLAAANRRLKDLELKGRPTAFFMPLRQAFVENLLRLSIGGV